jgi:hypothetical protein
MYQFQLGVRILCPVMLGSVMARMSRSESVTRQAGRQAAVSLTSRGLHPAAWSACGLAALALNSSQRVSLLRCLPAGFLTHIHTAAFCSGTSARSKRVCVHCSLRHGGKEAWETLSMPLSSHRCASWLAADASSTQSLRTGGSCRSRPPIAAAAATGRHRSIFLPCGFPCLSWLLHCHAKRSPSSVQSVWLMHSRAVLHCPASVYGSRLVFGSRRRRQWHQCTQPRVSSCVIDVRRPKHDATEA